MKKEGKAIIDRIIRNGKYIFPVIVLVAVAVTVVIALRMGGVRREELDKIGETITTQEPESQTPVPESSEEATPLIANEDADIHSVVATYYNAVAIGDEEALNRVCDKVEKKDMLRFLEMAKYIDHYPVLEIYTKPGFAPGDTVAYVYFRLIFTGQEAEYPGYQLLYLSMLEDGSLQIRRSNLPSDVMDYVQKISTEPDVVELINRVTVENDNLMAEQPELLSYLHDLNEEINRAIGVELAKQEGETTQSEPGQDETTPEGEGQEGTGSAVTIPEQVEEILYAIASTTVNVRASDSEKADRIGRVAGGAKIRVLEQLVNGWSKVLYENKEGYIMSKFLNVQESALKYTPIGTVKAKDTLNVRAQASVESAKMGTLIQGDTAELIADDGEWCKINFGGEIAYVKSEFVTVTLAQ